MSIDPAPSAPALPEREVYTVSRLALEVRALLEQGFALLWVEGEISNLTAAASGHVYFTLKDAHSQVRCVLWRTRARLLASRPANGDRVLARCRVSFYETRGEFQLDVQHLEPAGEGALLRAIEDRRRRLAALGLFDAARKRPLPALPRRIALITSPHGAAVHDVLTTLRRRWPALEVTLLGVPVQGSEAPAAIVRALGQAGACGELALLVRGGGAIEDLMAFNDEAVVHAIAGCAVPVVCGVGHEVDVTLADLAADRRAATPTGAAECAVPDQTEWLARLEGQRERLVHAMNRRVRAGAQRTDELERRLRHPAARLREVPARLSAALARLERAGANALTVRERQLAHLRLRLGDLRPALRVARARARLDAAHARLEPALRRAVATRARTLGEAGSRLHALSPLATLSRGYALVRDAGGGIVRDASTLEPGATVDVRLARGRIGCEVISVWPDAPDPDPDPVPVHGPGPGPGPAR